MISESLAPDAQLGGQNRGHLTEGGQGGSWETGAEVRGMHGRGIASGTHRVAGWLTDLRVGEVVMHSSE